MNSTRFALVLALLLYGVIILEARDGGRGGGGGGGGGGFGGRGGGGGRAAQAQGRASGAMRATSTIDRVPSMSRARSWSTGANPGLTAPRNANTSQLLPSRRQVSPTAQQGIRSQDQLRQFLRTNPQSVSPAMRQRRGNFNQNQTLGNNFRNRIREAYPHRSNWFGGQFWNNHNYRPGYWQEGQNLWRYAGWNDLNTWLGWGWGNPVYYEGGYPVYYETPPAPAANYSVQQAPAAQGANWLPLGVFAIVNNTTTTVEPTMFFQLILGKDGTIAGSYYNNVGEQVYPIDGLIDQNSQKAVWKMAVGQNSPIFETGVYNLTLPQTDVKVYFGGETQDEWFLVHMNE